jgi:hypothetical protein
MNNENEKENALKLAIAQVEKDFGKGLNYIYICYFK